MKLASGQHRAHFIQIQSEIYILCLVIAMQSTEFLKATTHKIFERAALKLCLHLFSLHLSLCVSLQTSVQIFSI